MLGHVLIIDAMSNRRIQLRAGLGMGCRKITVAESFAEGAMLVQQTSPDFLIIGRDTPGLDLPRLCQTLKLRDETQMVRVLVAVSSENASERCAALMAGAEDVIDYTIRPSELQAMLRGLQRRQQDWDAFRRQSTAGLDHGFAEAPTEFTVAPKVVAIGDDAQDVSERRLADTAIRLGTKIDRVSMQQSKRGLGDRADVIVLVEHRANRPMFDLLGMIRTNPNSRHAAVLYVSDTAQRHRTSPLDLGATEAVSSDASADEIAFRIRRLAHRKHREDEMRKEAQTLGDQVHFDALTGLHNRAYAEKYFAHLDRGHSSGPQARAMIMIDIDQFKQINDNHGHAAGDDVLKHVASVLRSNLRKRDLAARLGGDEMVVSILNLSRAEACLVAERLRCAVLNTPNQVADGTFVRATVSLGLAYADRCDPISSEALRSKADKALYAAKTQGRNRLHMADALTAIGVSAS